jgi:hypothetical protein
MKANGYTPSIFLKMIADHGTVEAVKRLLIKRSTPPSGFLKLVELGRSDLSIENIITSEQEWQDLFSEEERNEARRRLKGAGIK